MTGRTRASRGRTLVVGLVKSGKLSLHVLLTLSFLVVGPDWGIAKQHFTTSEALHTIDKRYILKIKSKRNRKNNASKITPSKKKETLKNNNCLKKQQTKQSYILVKKKSKSKLYFSKTISLHQEEK